MAAFRHWLHQMLADPVSFLTLVLAASTIGLWLSTRRLWQGAEAQAKHVEASAIAATKAADAALMALDRPWLFIENVRSMEGDSRDPTKRLRLAGFSITNYGNAPAIIHSIKALLFYSPGEYLKEAFPVKPLPSTMRDFPTKGELQRIIFAEAKPPFREDVNIAQIRGHTFEKLNKVDFSDGLMVMKIETTQEFIFQAEHLIDIDESGGLRTEDMANIYLVGQIMYGTPTDELEFINFCYEASALVGKFSKWGNAPYNERKRHQT